MEGKLRVCNRCLSKFAKVMKNLYVSKIIIVFNLDDSL